MTIRLLVADDHEVVRSGLGLMFRDSDVTVVGEVGTIADLLDQALRHKPDVVLLDVRLGDQDGLDAIEPLKQKLPSARVVVLSTYDNPTYLARAVALGASDYLLKGTSRADLVTAVRRAAHREPQPDGSLLRRIRHAMSQPWSGRELKVDSKAPLTERESQVLRHISLGLSNRDIGLALGISVETVKEHVQNILRKVDCSDRTAAAVWALRQGLT